MNMTVNLYVCANTVVSLKVFIQEVDIPFSFPRGILSMYLLKFPYGLQYPKPATKKSKQ